MEKSASLVGILARKYTNSSTSCADVVLIDKLISIKTTSETINEAFKMWGKKFFSRGFQISFP